MTSRFRGARALEVGLVPALLLAAIVLPPLVLADRLPDPLATHWTAGGRPDGTLPLVGAVGFLGAAWAAVWALLALGARRAGEAKLAWAPGALAAGGLLAGIQASIVLQNLDAPGWQAAAGFGPEDLLVALVPAALAFAAGLALEAGRHHARSTLPGGPLPSVGLAREERAVWVGASSSPLVAATGAAAALVLAGVAVVAGGGAAPALLAGAAVLAVAAASVASVRVIAGAAGVRVSFGPLAFPVKRIPLNDIEAAEAIEVEPMRWGGWGYRWVPNRNATAVVMHRGPGLHLTLRDGSVFVVTVDGAHEAAGLVNDYLARPVQTAGAAA